MLYPLLQHDRVRGPLVQDASATKEVEEDAEDDEEEAKELEELESTTEELAEETFDDVLLELILVDEVEVDLTLEDVV